MPAEILLPVAEVGWVFSSTVLFCFVAFFFFICGAVQTEKYQKSLKIEGCLLQKTSFNQIFSVF